MSSRIKQRLSFANVMSCIAVFIALSGSAYAAVELRKNQVRSKHIRNGQVKKADLGKNAVTSKKVVDATLLAQDFAPGQIPAGARGPAGPKGDKGDPGTDGKPGPLVDTLPSGKTLRGAFWVTATADAAFEHVNDSFSFLVPPEGMVEDRVVQAGGDPTPSCPGTVDAPQARPGILCVYVGEASNVGFVTAGVLPGRHGGFAATKSDSSGQAHLSGTWAVTAP